MGLKVVFGVLVVLSFASASGALPSGKLLTPEIIPVRTSSVSLAVLTNDPLDSLGLRQTVLPSSSVTLHAAVHSLAFTGTDHLEAHRFLAAIPPGLMDPISELFVETIRCDLQLAGVRAAIAERGDFPYGDSRYLAQLGELINAKEQKNCAVALVASSERILALAMPPIELSPDCNPLGLAQAGVTLISLGGEEANCHGPARIHIDLGGDDTYSGGSGHSIASVAVGLDLSGNDTYFVGAGSGAAGIGILMDGGGDDRYSSYNRIASSFAGGISILIDREGNDQYTCVEMCEAYAETTGSIALLWDQSGNDVYTATETFAQAAALMKGTAVLLDESGIDSYRAKAGGQGFATSQGIAWFVDRDGPDTYSLQTNSGRGFSEDGTGIASFLDQGGFDSYLSGPGTNDGEWGGGIAIPWIQRGKDCEIDNSFCA